MIRSIKKPDRCYIGSAVNISKRWKYHLQDLKRGVHHSKKLQRHYNKHGEGDLQFSILLGCNNEDLIKTEQYFIDSYKPYFNCSPTAGSTMGTKLSDEHRRKLSESHKGKRLSEEQKLKIANANKGRTCSKETISKIVTTRMANGGYSHTKETRRKISEIQLGKKRGKRKNWHYSAWNKGKVGIYSEEYLKKLSDSHKGKKMPEKQRLKMIGRKLSEEHKRRISESLKGEKNWLFGKHISEEAKKKMSEAKRGKSSWNKGIACSEITKKKISKSQKGRVSNRKGVKLSEETKRKIGEANKLTALRKRKILISN